MAREVFMHFRVKFIKTHHNSYLLNSIFYIFHRRVYFPFIFIEDQVSSNRFCQSPPRNIFRLWSGVWTKPFHHPAPVFPPRPCGTRPIHRHQGIHYAPLSPIPLEVDRVQMDISLLVIANFCTLKVRLWSPLITSVHIKINSYELWPRLWSPYPGMLHGEWRVGGKVFQVSRIPPNAAISFLMGQEQRWGKLSGINVQFLNLEEGRLSPQSHTNFLYCPKFGEKKQKT